MKTISELNSHWWYRLIKVAYLLILALIISITLFLVFDEFSPQFDKTKSFVNCLDGRNFSLKDYPTIYSDYTSPSDDKNFHAWCTTEKFVENGETKLRKLESYNSTEIQSTFIPGYTDRDIYSTIYYSFIGFLIIIFISEIIRRGFYYIVLGKIRPAKV